MIRAFLTAQGNSTHPTLGRLLAQQLAGSQHDPFLASVPGILKRVHNVPCTKINIESATVQDRTRPKHTLGQ